MVLSRLLLARTFPSGEKATAMTEPRCPLSVCGSASAPRHKAGANTTSVRELKRHTRFMVLGSVFEFGRGAGDEDVSTTVSMSSPKPRSAYLRLSLDPPTRGILRRMNWQFLKILFYKWFALGLPRMRVTSLMPVQCTRWTRPGHGLAGGFAPAFAASQFFRHSSDLSFLPVAS